MFPTIRFKKAANNLIGIMLLKVLLIKTNKDEKNNFTCRDITNYQFCICR